MKVYSSFGCELLNSIYFEGGGKIYTAEKRKTVCSHRIKTEISNFFIKLEGLLCSPPLAFDMSLTNNIF